MADDNSQKGQGRGWYSDTEEDKARHQEAGKKAAETTKKEYGDDFHEQIGSLGGQASPTKFQTGDMRTKQAAKAGGDKRAKAQDVTSGELGKKGAEARWGKDDD